MTQALSLNAKRQWADSYLNQDDRKTYYVNMYFDYGEGFNRRETLKDGLTKREAERLTNSLNKAAKHLGNPRRNDHA